MRTPRSMTFGSYNTHADGLWTLTGFALEDPALKTNLVEIPGSSELLDLSTALTDGEPTYGSRTLKATFESSEGDRLAREERISKMLNRLDGYRVNIVLPDDVQHYLSGRVQVKRIYNDMAHASVQVTAVCDPWRYDKEETVVSLQATATEQTAVIINQGRLSVVPTVTVQGDEVGLVFGDFSRALSAGTYLLPDLYLTPGEHSLKYSGVGSLTLTYRGAIL